MLKHFLARPVARLFAYLLVGGDISADPAAQVNRGRMAQWRFYFDGRLAPVPRIFSSTGRKRVA